MNQVPYNHIKVILPVEYPWVLFIAAMISLECWIVGLSKPMWARKKAFSRQYMEENFGRMHMEDATLAKQGAQLSDLANGYPDMGNGRYSAGLKYP